MLRAKFLVSTFADNTNSRIVRSLLNIKELARTAINNTRKAHSRVKIRGIYNQKRDTAVVRKVLPSR
jgi:hypothetical protein